MKKINWKKAGLWTAGILTAVVGGLLIVKKITSKNGADASEIAETVSDTVGESVYPN